MSGGTIGDYGYYKLLDAVMDIEYELGKNYSPPLAFDTVSSLLIVRNILLDAAAVWQAVDYLFSDDTSEENWDSEVSHIINQYGTLDPSGFGTDSDGTL